MQKDIPFINTGEESELIKASKKILNSISDVIVGNMGTLGSSL
ncbi:hypothetical protein [Helicobacter sp. 11S02596-1]|nr:hypothetical protein [Helicobacter sp. 11S02596-1]